MIRSSGAVRQRVPGFLPPFITDTPSSPNPVIGRWDFPPALTGGRFFLMRALARGCLTVLSTVMPQGMRKSAGIHPAAIEILRRCFTLS
ncbi:MAG: hypothetical protein AB7O67_22075 [Vicinamibacterales bacterium]